MCIIKLIIQGIVSNVISYVMSHVLYDRDKHIKYNKLFKWMNSIAMQINIIMFLCSISLLTIEIVPIHGGETLTRSNWQTSIRLDLVPLLLLVWFLFHFHISTAFIMQYCNSSTSTRLNSRISLQFQLPDKCYSFSESATQSEKFQIKLIFTEGNCMLSE